MPRCDLAFTPGELTVSAQTPDVGEALESLPVAFQGEPLEIGFNPEFLRDGLEAIEEGDVLLKLISPLRPGLIESADDERLPVPDHADQAERVAPAVRCRPASGCAISAATSDAQAVARATALTVVCGPQRRRQDEPARGAVLRLYWAARAGRPTSARWCASARARPASSSRADGRRWPARAVGRASTPGSRSECGSTARPVERLLDVSPTARW